MLLKILRWPALQAHILAILLHRQVLALVTQVCTNKCATSLHSQGAPVGKHMQSDTHRMLKGATELLEAVTTQQNCTPCAGCRSHCRRSGGRSCWRCFVLHPCCNIGVEEAPIAATPEESVWTTAQGWRIASPCKLFAFLGEKRVRNS